MKKLMMILFLSVIAAFSLSSAAYAAQPMQGKANPCMHCPCVAKMELRVAMRGLWDDHVLYTRNYIISNLAGLKDADAIAQRLLKNQDDIGNAIKTYYGDEAGKKLTALLREHIMIAANVVNAAKSGDKEALDKAQKEWYANADSIAAFLSTANPNWTKAALTDLLYTHLKITTDEVVARLHKDWNADIAAYDKGHAHMMMFADALTQGIAKQFPDKFKK
jgi:hypothetical protein